MVIFSTLHFLLEPVTIPTKICLDADWDYAESVISLEKCHLYHRVSSDS